MDDANDPDSAAVLTPTEARQGLRGRHVLWILVISMAALIIGYTVLVVGVQNTHLTAAGGQTRVDQKALGESEGTAPAKSADKQKSSGVTPGIGSDGKGL
jgi:hypothetical protein